VYGRGARLSTVQLREVVVKAAGTILAVAGFVVG
jgi:hypothetical protein